jgi:hypothetical protein
MKYPEIPCLYKYMSWNAFTRDSIESGKFWFSSPTKFNDPIDCGISLSTIGSTPFLTNLLAKGFSEIGKATGTSIKNPSQTESITKSILQFTNNITNNAETISEEINEAKADQIAYLNLKEKFASSGILSLSELGDNILMWSHYAQQHKGVCIEFERTASSILGMPDTTLPVRYSIKAPTIDARRYRVADNEERKEIENSLVLTKAADWTYEREWRVIKNKCANSTQTIDCKIASITLGLRAEDDTQEYVSSLAKRRGFKVKKAKLKENEFGLKIEEFQ